MDLSKGINFFNLSRCPAKCTYSFERSLNDDKNFFFHKKINYYIYIQGPSNIQSFMKNTLFLNFLNQKLII